VPPPRRERQGEAVFARYAFPPNELGHCGPPGAEVLLAGGSPDGDADGLRSRLEQFEGARPYLQVLADATGVDDDLDPDVVTAYWLGGELLDRVDPAALLAAVQRGFGGQPGVRERLAELSDLASVRANHVFHVFVVYPWVGLLGSASDVPRAVLDSCRVRWGTVVSVDGEVAEVLCRPLTWDGEALGLGPERPEGHRWTRDRRSFVPRLRVGDQVSLHWNWVCDLLDDDRVRGLADLTRRQLTTTNRWLARRPGLAAAG